MGIALRYDSIAPADSASHGVTIPVLDKGGAKHNVRAYGAVGGYNPADGTGADDGPAFMAARDAANAAGGGIIEIPAGDYNLASVGQYLSAGSDNITFRGDGSGVTRLYNAGLHGSTQKNLTFEGLEVHPESIWISGIVSNSDASPGAADDITVRDVRVIGPCSDGVLFYRTGKRCRAEKVYVEGAARIGVTVDFAGAGFVVRDCSVYDCKQGYHVEGSSDGLLENNSAEKCGAAATHQVPDSQQPDSYRSTFLLADAHRVTLRGNAALGAQNNGPTMQYGCTGVRFESNRDLGGYWTLNGPGTYGDFIAEGNENFGLYQNGIAWVGDLIVRGTHGSAYHPIQLATATGDRIEFTDCRVGRIQFGAGAPGSRAVLRNVDMRTQYSWNVDCEKLHIETVDMHLTNGGDGYPDFLGLRIDADIVRHATLRDLSSTGTAGNHIVVHGSVNTGLDLYLAHVDVDGTKYGTTPPVVVATT